MAASRRPRRRRHVPQPMTPFTLPSYWSPKQALAVFKCIELLRGQLAPTHDPPDLDPDSPF